MEGDAVAGSTLTVKTTPTNAKGNYQWFRAGEEDGEYTEIDDATDKTYTLTNEDIDKYIKVAIEGTGSYKGTATSDPLGLIEATLSEYTFEVTGADQDFVVGELQNGYVLEGEDGLDVTGHTPIKATLKASTNNGLGYEKVRILPLEVAGPHDDALQAWMYASVQDHKWWDIAVTGWGSAGTGFRLAPDEDSEMDVYIFANKPGTYEVTFKAVDTSNPIEGEPVITTGTATIIAREPEHSDYGFLSEHGLLPGEEHQPPLTVLGVDGLIADNSVIVTADQGVALNPGVVTDNALEALATALDGNYTKDDLESRLLEVTLKATDIKELGYDKVRILPLEIEKTHGEGNASDLQVWMYASAQDKAWHNIAKTGWGSKGTGFKLDLDEESEMKAYVFGTSPGVYEITFKAVDTSKDGEPVIATGIAEVIVTAGVSVSPLAQSHYGTGEILEFTISGLIPNEEVEFSTIIDLGGGGYSVAEVGPAAELEGMTGGGENGKGPWFGTANENGELAVKGTVQANLPPGELRITLPGHGYYLDNAITLEDGDGYGVRVGNEL